jgi:putative transposase
MQPLWYWLLRVLALLRRVVRHRLWLISGCPHWPRMHINQPAHRFRAHPKPAWVRSEIIRLKALMPAAGCRTIAHCFNRRFAVPKRMTVGKTYVADTVRRNQYAILQIRRRLKHRVPRPIPRNLIWGMDLAVKTDVQGTQHVMLAVLDHASRACLCLRQLSDKSMLTLLQHLVSTFRRYGTPKFLRTDNKAIFTSRRLRLALRFLGIRPQRTDPGCPWQNGRIERFIGTVKAALAQTPVDDGAQLAIRLSQIRRWYNHVRPHHHLQGRTPAEVWAGIDVFLTNHRVFPWWPHGAG